VERMTVARHVTKVGLRTSRGKLDVQRPTLKAEILSSRLGVPLAETKMGWSERLGKGFRRLGRRLKKTFGPDKALEGIKEPIPVDVLFARPIMMRRS
jgi:hypothetical protein